MFENDFFAEPATNEPSDLAKRAGKIGVWLLHLTKVLFLIYSGYHGVSASWNYAGTSEAARLAQVFGVVVLEITLLGLYIAWHNQYITGASQQIAAGLTYALGFTLACFGIVADSQLHAGYQLSGWLAGYLLWGLPLSSAAMALGAVLVHELAPTQLRARKQANENAKFSDLQFQAHMQKQHAEMEMKKTLSNMQLNARASAAQQIAAWYNTEQAQSAITATATQNAPAMLSAIGINMEQPLAMAAETQAESPEIIEASDENF